MQLSGYASHAGYVRDIRRPYRIRSVDPNLGHNDRSAAHYSGATGYSDHARTSLKHTDKYRYPIHDAHREGL
jgi:hypothetical protein